MSPSRLGLLPQRGLAHNHIVGVQKTTHMANGTTDAVEQHERLVAAPDGVALRIGQRGFHIDEVALCNDVADALDVVHLQIDRAFFVATLLQNEVVRLRLTG